jgi:DNA-binding LacI/PurR family transcriptional regulator
MAIKKRVTLGHIAEKAGVSKMTVSLALKGGQRISTETTERVRRIAAELGYTPDPALNALNAYRNVKNPPRFMGTIAFLTSFPKPIMDYHELPYCQDYFSGAKRRALELGFSLEELWLNQPRMTLRAAERILQSRGINALLIAPVPKLRTSLGLKWENYSAVALGRSLEQPQLHIVANNQFYSMRLCFDVLQQRGYRRIGLALSKQQDDRVFNLYSGGFLTSQLNCCDPGDWIPPLIQDRFDKVAFLNWFERERPDAVITGDMMVRDILQEKGCRIPRDVGVALPYGVPPSLKFACINERSLDIGGAALDVLAGMIYRNDLGVPANPQNVLLQGEWQEGATVRLSP